MNEARFLFRVYDNYNRVYVTDSLILHIKDGTRNYELFSPDAKQYTMEQCTGMEDCDGNLIFEWFDEIYLKMAHFVFHGKSFCRWHWMFYPTQMISKSSAIYMME